MKSAIFWEIPKFYLAKSWVQHESATANDRVAPNWDGVGKDISESHQNYVILIKLFLIILINYLIKC